MKNMIKKCRNVLLRSYGNKRKVVVVLRLEGVIGSSNSGARRGTLSLQSIKRDIDKAFQEPAITALALIINSPGGSPVQAELISKYIRRKSNDSCIPVYSFVEDVSASGGYWLACTGDQIYACESSLVGSIGVISSGFGFAEALKKFGVERRVITQGKNKNIYDPFMPVRPEDKKIIESVQADVYNSFKEFVKARRSEKLKVQDESLFTGEFWSGKRAFELGLIDGIGDLYTIMTSIFGDKVVFEYVEADVSWIKKKLGLQMNLLSSFVDGILDRLEERIQNEHYKLW